MSQVVHAIQSVSYAIGGDRRCPTGDDSRNHGWMIGLLSLGEWHTSYHYMMSPARQGFAWWEVDVQWLVLRGLSAVGLVWHLRRPSREVLAGKASAAPKLASRDRRSIGYARAMSLEEKRAIRAAEDGWVKARRAETAELCGAEIPYELDWASFAGDLKSIEWLEANGPHQVNVALRQICVDELGREAVRGAVKRIAFRAAPTADGKRVALADGVLEVVGKYGDGIAGTVREAEIKAYLLTQL